MFFSVKSSTFTVKHKNDYSVRWIDYLFDRFCATIPRFSLRSIKWSCLAAVITAIIAGNGTFFAHFQPVQTHVQWQQLNRPSQLDERNIWTRKPQCRWRRVRNSSWWLTLPNRNCHWLLSQCVRHSRSMSNERCHQHKLRCRCSELLRHPNWGCRFLSNFPQSEITENTVSNSGCQNVTTDECVENVEQWKSAL